MKEITVSSFTTEKPIDSVKDKDKNKENTNAAVLPLPESERPRKDGPGEA